MEQESLRTRHAPSALLRGYRAWHVGALLSIGLVTLGLAVLAERVSGHEVLRFGTVADRVYVTDGFHGPEENPEHGPYRWTHPLAYLTLPNWGPGRLHVSISGVGAAPSEALLKIGGEPVGHATIEPGQPWTVQAWGVAASRNPTVTLEGPPFSAPGDARQLGRLVAHMEIYAPDARLRAWLNLGLLSLTALLLYAALLLWTGRPGLALMVGASVPAVYGLLTVYRDPWMDVVAWTAPLTLAVLLTLSLLNKRVQSSSQGYERQRGAVRGMSVSGGRSVVGTYVLRTHRPHASRITHHTSRFPFPVSRFTSSFFATVALTSALLLLAQGFLNAFDSERMYQVAAGLGEYGLPTRYPGRDVWTKYGFGQPLLAVPFYWLGKLGVLLGGDYAQVTRFAVSLTNLPVTALTCWLLYRASRLFAPVGVSLAVAATYLLATPALNYARTFFSEPAGAALLLASTLLLLPRKGELAPSNGRIALAGVLLGAMIWLKPAFVVYWPAPALAVLVMAAMAARHVEVQSSKFKVQRVMASGALFSIGLVVGGVVQLGYNYLRYGDLQNWLFRTGYEREEGFSTPLLEGLYGLLFSPGKSIFLYASVLLLMPLGLWFMYRRGASPGKVAATLILAQSVAGLTFNAMWWAWTGNFAWGPRLIMPVLPLLVWPLAMLIELKVEGWRFKVVCALWGALAVLGALANIPGAMVDFQVYFRLYGLELAGEPGEGVTLYQPEHSPLLVEPGYLWDGLTAAIYRPSLADVGMPPVWDVLVPGALTIIALLASWAATHKRAVDQV